MKKTNAISLLAILLLAGCGTATAPTIANNTKTASVQAQSANVSFKSFEYESMTKTAYGYEIELTRQEADKSTSVITITVNKADKDAQIILSNIYCKIGKYMPVNIYSGNYQNLKDKIADLAADLAKAHTGSAATQPTIMEAAKALKENRWH